MESLGRLSQAEFDSVDIHSLDELSSGEEITLSPLQFDHGEYTPLEQFVHNLALLPEKPKRVHKYQLSINGKVAQDSMDLYLANKSEGSSALKTILNTPYHYLIEKEGLLPKKDAEHFDLGTFCHSAFLEPKKFKKVLIEPKASKTTTEGCKEQITFYSEVLGIEPLDCSDLKIGFLRDHIDTLKAKAKDANYTFVKEDHAKIIECIRFSYMRYGDGLLPKLFKYVMPEVSMYGKDPSTGIRVKVRPDAIMLEEDFGMNGIVSMKTTNATSKEAFERDAAKFKYELSEGMYLDVASNVTGRKFTTVLMVVMQTQPPYATMVLYWNAEDLQIGKYKYYQALDVLKRCRETNEWLGFDCKAENGNYGIMEMKLPAYVKMELPSQGI